MEELDDYCGTWRIVKCLALPQSSESTGIEGTEFTLDESGDVTWNVPEDTEPMPFFNCETYELYSSNPHYLRFFGTFVGHVIEFQVDRPKDDTIQLTYEGWCILQCERVLNVNSKQFQSTPYSFLCALVEGYFSDLTICANNGKEFKVHKTILKLGNSAIDWDISPCPLANLPEDVLYTILHYLYSECLPDPLDDETAKSCLAVTCDLPGFEEFKEICQLYLKNNALLDQILTLVEEIHSSGDRIIDFFSGKSDALSCSSTSSDSDDDVNFANDPSILRYIIIQALKESAIVGAKILVLCDIFSKRKNELCRAERHELIEYLKSRLPDFMKQLHRFLEVIEISFGNLTSVQRMDIASYFVSDIEHVLDVKIVLITEIKTALEQIINASSSKKDKNYANFGDKWKHNVGQALGKSLKNALHMRELMKLRSFHERVLGSFMNLMHKKEVFSDMNSVNKTRTVANNLEWFIVELPMFMLRTKELTAALDEKLTFKEWKYWFKLGTSKVAWVLNRLACHRETLDSIIRQIDRMVESEQFTRCLVQLSLLDAAPAAASPSSSYGKGQIQTNGPKRSEIKSFHESPVASESRLAKNAVSFLKKGLDTDMCFEIVTTTRDSSENSLSPVQSPKGAYAGAGEDEAQHMTIKAHCIVIASRCDWFRKALLSGMKESINKKIVIHDTTPHLFLIFLKYLYGGQVDTGQLSTEQLADLMQLSDRYEVDCLKQISEDALKNLIDDDSALFLLGIADQFNARALRTAALEFIALNKDIIKSEVFYDLPEDLQSEVEEMITWVELRNSQRSEELSGPQFLNHDSPSSLSSSLLDIEELFSAVNISGKEGEQASDSSSLEDLPLTQDSAQLEACVAQLRDIVGESVPRDELVRVSLAADYDVNRALNFFFSRFT
ncbi:BTB domain-containing protein [Trichonephila inaurata madagascariensis]|uniref:BTB domain-containing protein n=1 Tax=Trichonephila inaurata madagascariensis TaxID=2747483 RepID=A0A8X6WLM6_9ARAC|nr:BTB domain-containing protein [Trichonephila inaurata madagascariensis]